MNVIFLVLFLYPLAVFGDVSESKSYQVRVDKQPRISESGTYTIDQEVLAKIDSKGNITFPGDPKKAFEVLWQEYQKRCECQAKLSGYGVNYLNGVENVVPR